MESIVHGSFFHQDDHHHGMQDQHHTEALLTPPKISLRTMSKSDPHLDIPHLLMSQDEAHPSLNKMMSNLQHVHEGLRTPVSSHPNLQALRKENEFKDKSAGSAALLSQDNLQQPVLRKSSSAIDWNGAVTEATRKVSRQFDWQAALFDNSRKPSFSNLHNTQAHPGLAISSNDQSSQGGLVMNKFDNKQQDNKNMSAVTASMPPQQNHFAQTLASSSQAASSSAPSITTAPTPAPEPHQAGRPANTGMFGGMFHRGFFSKPVERSDEENYRYLLALDR